MRKRALSTLLCAALILSFAACGGGKSGENSTEPPAGSVADSQQTPGQQTTDSESPNSPKDSASDTENKSSDTENKNDGDSEPFIDSLKKEYENGIAFGQTKDHTFVPGKYINADGRSSIGAIIDGEKVYVILSSKYNSYEAGLYDYNMKTKEAEFCEDFPSDMVYYTCLGYLDGYFYFWENNKVTKVNPDGDSVSSPAFSGGMVPVLFDGGILCSDQNRDQFAILSSDMQISSTVPAPEQEAKHGILEKASLRDNYYFTADGTVYGASDTNLFKLDVKTSVWTDMGELPANYFNSYNQQFCGKYFTDQQKIYDILTGEEVFAYGVMYKSTAADSYKTLSYFGGDEYIGVAATGGKNEYRRVNLKENSMSDPLNFPEANSTIIDDTRCVYRDEYGVFLWNYETGEEDTILLFKS